MCMPLDGVCPGSFVRSFRFGLSILCFFVSLTVLTHRIGIAVAIVCMVNHTAVELMTGAHHSSSNSSSEESLETVESDEWLVMNESYNVTTPMQCKNDSEVICHGRSLCVYSVARILEQVGPAAGHKVV